jgi:pimeloyl-ACP methyl ester carboxylesterase
VRFFLLSFLLCSSFLTPLAFGQKTVSEESRIPPELPYSPKNILVSGLNINFVEAGKGPPILFLHGLGGSWKDWAFNLPFFSYAYRAIAIDFPGFGDSAKPETDYSIGWLTTIVDKFLQEQKVEQAVVVGHSMGGLVALNLAAQPGSRVKYLVVVDVVGIGDKAEFLSYALTKKIMGPESNFESFEGLLREEFKAMVDNFIKRQKPKTSKEFFQSVPKNPFTGKPFLPMTPAVQMSASIIDFDIRPQLALIRQPTLILWGGRDPIAPRQGASFLQSQIPHATLKILSHCGHSPMQEQPDRFHRQVEKFLYAAESGSSR